MMVGFTSAQTICTNTCTGASDGYCDDGGPGSYFYACDIGTDCVDCGPRPSRLTLCPSASCGACTYGPVTLTYGTPNQWANEYYYKTDQYYTCSACSGVASGGRMYVYQAYDGNGNALNGYLWFDCSNGRWTRSVVGAGDSACPYQWACTGPYPTGTTIDPVWSSCPYSGAQTCSASSPPPPPPSPPYFTVTSGPCTVDPNSRNCIRSPNYPSSYLNSQTCIITPTSLAIGLPLTATAFITEAVYDYLSIPSYESGTMTDFSGTIGPSNFVLGPGSIL